MTVSGSSIWASVFSLALLCGAGVPAVARADLTAGVDAVLRDDLIAKASVGIKIVRLGKSADDSPVLYQHNPAAPLVPASNLKLITTSAALEKLGADFSFHTILLRHSDDLIVIGDGDPSLGDAEMLKKVGWDVDTVFKTWAQELVKRNVKSVHQVIVDDSVFDELTIHPHWPADQLLSHYEPEVAGLNLNTNCLDVYVRPNGPGQPVVYWTNPATSLVTMKSICIGGNDNSVWLSRPAGSNDITIHGIADHANDVPVQITIHDPSLYAGSVLADTLKSASVAFTGTVTRDRTMRAAYIAAARAHDKSWEVIGVHETPLPRAIARCNKDSMNLYAECICKRLGFATSSTGSWQTGTAAVGAYLHDLGISKAEYTLDDGCGLSKENAISPNLIATVLIHDYFGKNTKEWMASLSVDGEDGTLAKRFHGSTLRGRVVAKTGFVNGVSCLSGYVHARDDNWYCFSIMFNGIAKGSNSHAKQLQEDIIKAIDASVPESHQAH